MIDDDAFSRAIPPPDTIPSFIAALVAQIASSTLSLFSFNSISELAPTFTIATLAASSANLLSNATINPGTFSVLNLFLTCLINSFAASGVFSI